MKLALTLLVVLAACATTEIHGAPYSDKQYKTVNHPCLIKELDDFISIIPVQKIKTIFYSYIALDEEFYKNLDYVLSDDFASVVFKIASTTEVQDFLKYIEYNEESLHVCIDKIINIFRFEEIDKFIDPFEKLSEGLSGFIQDLINAIPFDEIKKVYKKKLTDSVSFAKLVEHCKSQEFKNKVNKIMLNSHVQSLIHQAEASDVGVYAVLDFFTSILGLQYSAQSAQRDHKNLKDDLNDFMKLVPKEKIKDTFFEYLAEDEDFGEAIDYILSDEFTSLIREVEGMDEVKELLHFLQDSGLNAYGFINKINEILGLEKLVPPRSFKASRISGGLPGFIQDIKALLPVDKIEKLYNEKLKTSKDFATLIQRLQSKEFQGLVDRLMANPKLQNLMKRAEAKGVDVQAILDFISSVLGLKFPSRPHTFANGNLKDDLNDFMKLVPKEKILNTFFEYLEEDEDFGETIDYVLSDEFTSLIREVEDMNEVKQLLHFLQDSGLNAYGFINKINEILGLEKLVPPRSFKASRISGGLPGFIQDIKALLPVDKIEKLYNEKLKTSKDFATLIQRLQSKEFQGLVDRLMANPKLQNLMKRAEAKGVDVQAILDFISSVLGLKFPSRPHTFANGNLKDDLNDFMKLVPKEKILNTFFEYLEEDEDFGETIDYVLSDEFTSLIREVEDMNEVKQLLHFLQDSGLNAYGFINKINEILGLEKLVPPRSFKASRISGGLPGFIQDIKALLPVDKIEKLYNEKLKTSKDFATLIQRLQSKEFQGLVDRLMANPKLQNLMKRAEAKGVDVQAILDFISSVLGLKFPSRPHTFANGNLKDDLNDFMKLVPKEKILNTFFEYLEEDEDFGETIDYVLSDEFTSLIREVEDMNEVKQLLHFLQDSGLNAYGFINKINEILGLEKLVPPRSFKASRISGGLPGFIQDIKALLPVDKIEKLYNEKLKTSKDFATLIQRLQSKEFQGLVDRLMANPKLQNLMKRAEAKGVDVQAILDFISSVLGLKFPSRPHTFANRNLKDDLNDFMKLVPKEKILNTFFEYLAEDEDFGETIDYVLSDEFTSLIREVEDMNEVKQLLHFLQDSGLNAYGFINKINEILGLEKLVPPRSFKASRISGGLPGFIQDIKALLPVDKIEKLYNEKLKTSKDFATLIQRLQSKEFQGLVDRLMANPKLQNLIKRAETKGVDVQAILDFISSVLGLKFPSRSEFFKEEEVIDVLHVMWSKIPLDEILETLIDYLVQDDDFKKVTKHILSEEFKDTLVSIEELPEIKLLLKFLDETGINVYTWINNFHELIGLKKRVSIHNSYNQITGGIPGLLKDIRSLLPLDELHDYYDEKLETSKKFKKFINRLRERELQNAVYALNKHKGFNVLLDKLEALGVDWDEVVEIISAILGINFPDRPF